jgi:D-sedoheptulose 7-phosphate isomerase
MDRTVMDPADLLTPVASAPPDHGARRGFRALLDDRRGLLDADRYEAVVERIARTMVAAFSAGRKVLWMGNGGSAADAQHLAAEFSGRFLRERRGLPSEAISTNTSALTAIGNDFGFDQVFARQIEAFTNPGDVVVGITTSGNSKNIVLGLEEAKRRGATTIAFTGNGGGAVAEIADIALVGPDGYSALVQEVHITLGHIVCDLVEQALIVSES